MNQKQIHHFFSNLIKNLVKKNHMTNILTEVYFVKESIQIIPTSERPRERLVQYGAKALADYELLAIILRTGAKGESVLTVARELTTLFTPLSTLLEATVEELIAVKGIGQAKAIELLAALELGRRIVEPNPLGEKLTSPQSIYRLLYGSYQHLKQEQAICLFLNVQNQVIAKKTLSIGTLEYTVFHPRDILKWALKYSAYAIVLAHNHPSGNALPSEMDKNMTHVVYEACETIGIKMIDHIIIGSSQFYSFAEYGWLRK
jgi:DNA repair protein RadC